MTLYISEKSDLRTAAAYLIISVILAFAGAVYEYFSFGVYSYFMIYAFAIPLCLGTIPFMIKYMRSSESNGKQQRIQGRSVKTQRSEDIYHSAVAALTAGSIVHGALMICGRPNSLVLIYPAAAAILLLIYSAASMLSHLRTRRTI